MSPTARYLLKETLLRWRTRPSSPLARCVLTFTLAATAAGFLIGFNASAEALRSQLARLGFNTLVVRTVLSGSPLQAPGSQPPDHWALPLASEGHLIILQQRPTLGTTSWGEPVPVFVTDWASLARLNPGTADQAPAVLLTTNVPAGRWSPVQITHGCTINAISLAPEGPWRALIDGDAVIVAPGVITDTAPAHFVEVVLFTPRDPAALTPWAAAIRRLPLTSGGAAPSLQDPGPLRESLAALEKLQALWRSVVLGLLGLGVALVYGAIGVLEQREMRYTQALLRSMGVRTRVLWGAAFCENIFIANSSLAVALISAARLAPDLLPGFPAFDHTAITYLPLSSCQFLACVVNGGVLLSLLPLARALRRPIGTLLA